jgi:hypothetical protein
MAGFDVSNLSSYTKQVGDIFAKAVLPETLFNTVEVMPNVKYKTALNLLNKSLVLKAANCGPTPTGSTIFNQRTLEVCPINAFDKFCMYDLEQYWMNEKLFPGSTYTDLDWIQNVYLADLAGRIQVDVQKIFWQGNTDSGTGNLALCDGIWWILSGETSRLTTGSTTITVANIVDQINMMILKVPAEIAGNALNIYLSHSLYNMFVQGWASAYPYGYSPMFTNNSMSHPFYANITFAPQSGLEGTNYIFIGERRNFVYGTDIKDEYSRVQLTYNPFDKYVYSDVTWKQGAQVKWPDLIVANF